MCAGVSHYKMLWARCVIGVSSTTSPSLVASKSGRYGPHGLEAHGLFWPPYTLPSATSRSIADGMPP